VKEMEEEINFFLIGLTSLNHELSFLVVFIFAVLDPKQRPMIFILKGDNWAMPIIISNNYESLYKSESITYI
jgi:hypothetical protein